MDVLIWIIIVALFIISFIGLIYPIIPAVLMLWAGIILYYFFIDASALSWWTWGSLIALTIAIFVADYLASMYFVKKYGASKHGMTAATIGLIVGSFIIPPFGILIVPFVLVLVIELLQQHSLAHSFKAAVGTLLGFLTSTFAKGMIQLTLIGIFLVDVLIF
ncbi:DUF456 domain-containing protein [Salipaludibacillus sp. CF4.18]|uniref:DUF456 domain-containing protein n=1 Tax=Salipaludibacillus sp. CF4.18 TaxID=3373081 RepID=UPI003EE8185B